MRPYLFSGSIIPDEFIFPLEFLECIKGLSAINIQPWKFLADDMALSLYYFSALLLKYPESKLIPFAICSDASGLYNDGYVVLACFDAADIQKQPPVRIYDYSAPAVSPWDNLSFANFSEWFKAAKKESEEYQKLLLESDDD